MELKLFYPDFQEDLEETKKHIGEDNINTHVRKIWHDEKLFYYHLVITSTGLRMMTMDRTRGLGYISQETATYWRARAGCIAAALRSTGVLLPRISACLQCTDA